MYTKKAHIHFIGIGGIGMSGIATILKHQGYVISGCDTDVNQQSITQLQKLGCFIYHGNNTPHCHDNSIDILVYSSAIKSNDPEIISAQQRGIPTIPRALMLAELMRTKYSIAIAGSHGKTTTTSLVSHILIQAGMDPTVIIGGHLKTISHNAQFGTGDFLVAEADESDKSLVYLHPTIALVTNIDLEHLETYHNLSEIKEIFSRFLAHLPFYGKAFLCVDDENVRSLLPISHIKTITYGLSENADVTAYNISLHPDHSVFSILHYEKKLGTITFNMPGMHNVQNATGAIAICLDLGVDFITIAKSLKEFGGVERRFSYKGSYKGADIFDDYGHHPKEIEQTLIVARKRTKGQLTVLFQPHRYTRTAKLWHEFINVFLKSDIDHLIITDIYPASETPIINITSSRMAQELKNLHPKFTISYIPYQSNFSDIKKGITPLLHKNDLLLLLGAGKANQLANHLI